MSEPLDLFTAVAMMRSASKQNTPFSLTFMSYSIAKRKSHGPVTINKCILTKASTKKDNRYADSMLNVYDLEQERSIRVWQPLLMYFNGHKLSLQ